MFGAGCYVLAGTDQSLIERMGRTSAVSAVLTMQTHYRFTRLVL
jgi:hypothetical protein